MALRRVSAVKTKGLGQRPSAFSSSFTQQLRRARVHQNALSGAVMTMPSTATGKHDAARRAKPAAKRHRGADGRLANRLGKIGQNAVKASFAVSGVLTKVKHTHGAEK